MVHFAELMFVYQCIKMWRRNDVFSMICIIAVTIKTKCVTAHTASERRVIQA